MGVHLWVDLFSSSSNALKLQLFHFQINYCGPNANCNNHPGFFECNEDDCKDGYTNWQANKGISGDE